MLFTRQDFTIVLWLLCVIWLVDLSLFFLLGKQVQDSSDVIKDGRVRVVFNVPHEPQLETLIQNQHVRCTHTHTPVKAFNRVDSEDTCHAYTICASHTYCLASMCLYFVEVLCEVQSWIRSGISSRSHQLPRLPLLRKHLYWKRLQEKVSVQPPYNIHLVVTFSVSGPNLLCDYHSRRHILKTLIRHDSSGTNVFFSIICSPCGEQKANVGLNLKFNKKNEEVPGYTKRTEKEWLYSVAVEDLLAEYLDR